MNRFSLLALAFAAVSASACAPETQEVAGDPGALDSRQDELTPSTGSGFFTFYTDVNGAPYGFNGAGSTSTITFNPGVYSPTFTSRGFDAGAASWGPNSLDLFVPAVYHPLPGTPSDRILHYYSNNAGASFSSNYIQAPTGYDLVGSPSAFGQIQDYIFVYTLVKSQTAPYAVSIARTTVTPGSGYAWTFFPLPTGFVSPLDANFSIEAAVTVSGTGTHHLFLRDASSAIYHGSTSGFGFAWETWAAPAGRTLVSNLAATTADNVQLRVFASDSNGDMSIATWNPQATPALTWSSLAHPAGVVFKKKPGVTSYGTSTSNTIKVRMVGEYPGYCDAHFPSSPECDPIPIYEARFGSNGRPANWSWVATYNAGDEDHNPSSGLTMVSW